MSQQNSMLVNEVVELKVCWIAFDSLIPSPSPRWKKHEHACKFIAQAHTQACRADCSTPQMPSHVAQQCRRTSTMHHQAEECTQCSVHLHNKVEVASVICCSRGFVDSRIWIVFGIFLQRFSPIPGIPPPPPAISTVLKPIMDKFRPKQAEHTGFARLYGHQERVIFCCEENGCISNLKLKTLGCILYIWK